MATKVTQGRGRPVGCNPAEPKVRSDKSIGKNQYKGEASSGQALNVELRRYCQLGWPIFPVKYRDKKPACEHGFKDASRDLAVIEAWFSADNHNIGLPTGVVSGVAVLDVDPRNGGNESLQEMLAKHGPLPKGPMALTGGSGRHYFFACPGKLNTWKPAPGLDLKGDGGYVVAPPSIHQSGNPYQWAPGLEPDALPLPALPSWCIKRQRPVLVHSMTQTHIVTDAKTGGERYFIATVGKIRDRLMITTVNRNNELNKGAFYVGTIWHLGNGHHQWALNALRLAAQTCGLEQYEIEPTIQSGLRAGMNFPKEIIFEERSRGRRSHG